MVDLQTQLNAADQAAKPAADAAKPKPDEKPAANVPAAKK